MNTIYKYPIEVTDTQVVRMPKNAEILSIQVQNETVCLWAKVDSNEKVMEERSISVYGTGHPMVHIGGKEIFLGTIQLAAGKLVFHVFERTSSWE